MLRLLLSLLLAPMFVQAQTPWTFTPMTPLPAPNTNGAVCSTTLIGYARLYQFGGIGQALAPAAIHRHAYRYDLAFDAWTALPEIPDTLGKIASAASIVGDTAYVIGGYHVFNYPPFERSSNRVHRLNLQTEQWMSDGTNVPLPIDDHVQCVWRDSLIYTVTGWSNTGHVTNVQVYDPAHDTWSAGTPVPDNSNYKVFGAAGTIIGDTIFYYGGASAGANFPAQDEVRMGVIDPLDPTNITWLPAISTGRACYRPACSVWNNKPFWLGGAPTSYNYDAVAYNGSGIVSPHNTIARLRNDNSGFDLINTNIQVMDLRGVGLWEPNLVHVVGGIGPNAVVLNSNLRLDPVNGISSPEKPLASVRIDQAERRITISANGTGPLHYTVLNMLGQQLLQGNLPPAGGSIEGGQLPAGIHILNLFQGGSVQAIRFWLGSGN